MVNAMGGFRESAWETQNVDRQWLDHVVKWTEEKGPENLNLPLRQGRIFKLTNIETLAMIADEVKTYNVNTFCT